MASGKIKTHDEFVQEVIELRGDIYDFLSEYKDAKTMIKIKHKTCGYIWETNPNNLRKKDQKGKVCCPNCNGGGKSIGTERFKVKVKNIFGEDYIIIGFYVNSNTPIIVKHNIEECGHEYFTIPSVFLKSKNNCPKCKPNAKRTTEEFKQIVYELEGNNYQVLSEYINNETKITFKNNENECNHIFEMTPAHFLRGERCSKCANNNKKTTEQYRQEIYKLVGNEYALLGEYINSKTKVKMRHEKCGNTWDSIPSNFLNGTRCPDCFGTSKKSTDCFKQEVCSLVGNEYVVLGEYVNALTKIKMKHNSCGHVYEVLRNDFLNGRRCPFCKESKGEKKISKWLDIHNIKFIPQKRYENLKGLGGGLLSYDFYIPSLNLLVEYQGGQHEGFVKGMHETEEGFQKQKEHDRRKREYATKNNIKLLEIWHWDFENVEEILETNLI